MANMIGNVVNFAFMLIGCVILLGILFKITKNTFSKVKEIDAIVIDKQHYAKRIYTKSQAPYTKNEYVITFLCNKKKIHLTVSELSYKHYKLNQKGILVVKGYKIIDFKN